MLDAGRSSTAYLTQRLSVDGKLEMNACDDAANVWNRVQLIVMDDVSVTEHPSGGDDPGPGLVDLDGVGEDFVATYKEHYPRLVRAPEFSGANRSTAEDVTQEAFARALGHCGRVRRGTNPAGYVHRVAFGLARRSSSRKPLFARESARRATSTTKRRFWRTRLHLWPRNWTADEAVPNFTIADTAGSGKIDAFANKGNTVNLVIDVAGYFTTSGT